MATLFSVVSFLAVQAAGAAEDEAQKESAERESLESVRITATRTREIVQDEPLRVEVVPDAEIEENVTVAPGNLTNLLNELAGVRLQSAAPGLGGTALRFRGLPGRHAQILTDGLPLGGPQTDAFGLLQTPPLDLGRVEVIKGVASAIYGGSALAGVMNLVSRPAQDESEIMLNQTSRGGSDAIAFLTATRGAWGYTLIGSADYQSRRDPDHDGWAELPGYKRVTMRPRVHWSDGPDRTFLGTLGFMQEHREGGTMRGRTLPSGEIFPQALRTRRIDGGATLRLRTSEANVMHMRWAASLTEHDQEYGATRVEDKGTTVFGELSTEGELRGHKWTLGAAIQYERLRSPDVAGVGVDYTVPGIFVQDEFALFPWLSFAASARVDVHNEFGTFFSPRLSALFRTGESWSLRGSIGAGFAAPTPLIEEVQERSLAVLDPLTGLRAERGYSASVDAKWARGPWDVNFSVFASQIRHPLMAVEGAEPGRLALISSTEPLRVHGAELLVGYTHGPWHVLANSTYLDATEGAEGGGRTGEDLVPRFSAEVACILEDEERGRVGIEIQWTGTQPLDDDPFRAEGRGYLEINALVEARVGRAAIFLNALNLTNVRQGDFAPILRPTPGLGGQPVTEAWAPVVGRTFNLGVRAEL